MMFKHHIGDGDVSKPISDLFQTDNNYHSYMYSLRNSQSLRSPIDQNEAIFQTFTYIGSIVGLE